jgi:hypothetical protein
MSADEHFVRASRLYDAERGEPRAFEWSDRSGVSTGQPVLVAVGLEPVLREVFDAALRGWFWESVVILVAIVAILSILALLALARVLARPEVRG